ncbi:DUF6950 family protein [Sagittula stellata]|uniref:DUF6950 domain-containing protein n=1 Tax=Sagittula stellata (strain ATCC 700073 / DSM 11524 / E-37) TaxID=388399 RepID=A3KA66_SAGS3|nr:hypothetical protein [Sagittula stellata]EBA06009.1 hypothetical protein SSE37_25413 [Sagittula stellata E-37]
MKPLYVMMHRWAATPFVWGESDCCLCLADWYNHVHGKDPAAHLRGQYCDALSCQRLCGWFSDPVTVIENCLETVGGRPLIDAPALGDVGVILIRSKDDDRPLPAGAIWLGDCWGCKGPTGATTINAQATRSLAVWGIGYEG